MVLQWNFNIFEGSIETGSVTSAWWVQFATALIFGLAFSTLLTLVLVPTLLAAPTVLSHRWRGWKADTMALYTRSRRRQTGPPACLSSKGRVNNEPRFALQTALNAALDLKANNGSASRRTKKALA